MASIAYCSPGLRFTLFKNNILRSVTLTDVSRNACSTCWIRSFQFEQLVRPNLSTPIIQLLLSDIDAETEVELTKALLLEVLLKPTWEETLIGGLVV
ncbi:hypothetical protein DPMN_019832 [Dreissena polymorpha]|uniref:Plus3 domain-containing protein n=1 Tax=Dreissena polymorpha TaxID=45954 RepID=A0A9D4SAJ4_DREPO|nr:hypothetical protein DPMN_019832 [Dreissena polymorpha]